MGKFKWAKADAQGFESPGDGEISWGVMCRISGGAGGELSGEFSFNSNQGEVVAESGQGWMVSVGWSDQTKSIRGSPD